MNLRYRITVITRGENALKQALEKFTPKLKEACQNHDMRYLKTALKEIGKKRSMLEAHLEKLMNEETEELSENDKKLIDEKMTGATEIIQKAQDIIDELETQIEIKEESGYENPKTITRNVEMQLPPIPIPKFNGDVTKWKNFYHIFDKTVGQKNITNLEKFNYLVQSMEGSARKLMERFEINDENYEMAMSLLRKRFENDSEKIKLLTQQLENERAVSPRLEDQRSLFDKIFTIVQQLKGLNQELNSRIIKNTILRKFSIHIQKTVYEHRADNYGNDELGWNIDVILEQVENSIERCQQIEDLLRNSRKKNESNYKTITKSSSSILRCVYCNSNHLNKDCHMTVQQKRDALREKQKCWKCLRNHHTMECTSSISCKNCQGHHIYYLCLKKSNLEEKRATHSNIRSNLKDLNEGKEWNKKPPGGILPTVTADAFNPSRKQWDKITIMFDSGADNTYLSKQLTREWKLNSIGKTELLLQTFGEKKLTRGKFDITRIKIRTSEGTMDIKALIAEKLIGKLPSVTMERDDLEYIQKIPRNITLTNNKTITPDIIIGMDYMFKFWKEAAIELPSGLHLIQTIVGPIVMGRKNNSGNNSITFTRSNIVLTNDEAMKWDDKEEFTGPTSEERTNELISMRKTFNDTIEKREDGYYVRLPFKEEAHELPTNYAIAYKRLVSVLKNNDSNILKQIDEVFQEQLKKNIIEEVNENDVTTGLIHYNPHQPVITPHKATTKCRVVIDGSAHFKNERSLNDVLHQGEVILPDLKQLLIRFRSGKTVIVSDVEKAFLAVHVHEADRDATRVLWVKDTNKPPIKDNIVTLRFKRVIFGLNCSPFLLGAAIEYHLKHSKEEISKEIENQLYVDNLILTTDEEDVDKLINKYNDIKKIFNEMNMNIRQFLSNRMQFNEQVNDSDRSEETTMKILGIPWISEEDCIEIKCQITKNKIWTKRKIASTIGAIFDPTGFMTPLTLPLKLEQQKLWEEGLDWDTPLPREKSDTWEHVLEEINNFVKVIPRQVIHKSGKNTIITCTDASNLAVSTAVYIVNNIGANLIYARSKIRPTKEKWTIPKLELKAVCMGVEATKMVAKALKDGKIEITQTIVLTDSEIAKSWIYQPPGKGKGGIYVTNRLREIRKAVDELKENGITVQFGYIRTNNNPADFGTRGLMKSEMANDIWWHGPDFIKEKIQQWPQETKLFILDENEGEENSHINTAKTYCPDPDEIIFNCEVTNSFEKMIRITGYTLKFIRKCINNIPHLKDKIEINRSYNNIDNTQEGYNLTTEELIIAEKVLIRDQQKSIDKKQLYKLRNLNLVRDEMGIIRCHGRMQNMNGTDDEKKLILIPPQSNLTTMIIRNSHRQLHKPVGATMIDVRNKYWIPRLRSKTRQTIRKCTVCQRFNNLPYSYPPMNDLPDKRVKKSRPFEHIGIDYFGPLQTIERKTYGCIITCLTTRMTFIELVDDLSTTAFLNSMRRFTSIYGTPTSIVSDNGPQFVLAEQIINNAIDDIPEWYTQKRIKWKFNTPFAPWQGGIFERLIKIIKESLFKSIGRKKLSIDSLRTTLFEIANMLNLRPLTYIEETIDDVIPIRPIDFIQKEFELVIFPQHVGNYVDEYATAEEEVKLLRSREAQKAVKSSAESVEKFWTIWKTKYIQELREVQKLRIDEKRNCKEYPKEGTVVIIIDENQPRFQWKLGRISKLVTNGKGEIREAEITITTNPNTSGWNKRTIRRPVNKIIPLELDQDEDEPKEDAIIDSQQEQTEEERRYNLRPRRKKKYDDEVPISRSNAIVTKGKWTYMMLTMLILFMANPSKAENQEVEKPKKFKINISEAKMMETKECSNINVECGERGVTMEMKNCTVDMLEICAAQENKCKFFGKIISNYISILPPPQLLTTSNQMVVKLWKKGENQLEKTIQCEAKDICEITQCLICWTNFYHPRCIINMVLRNAAEVLIIGAIAIILIAGSRRIAKKDNSRRKASEEQIENKEDEKDTSQEPMEMRSYRSSTLKDRLSNLPILMVIFMSLVTIIQACDQVIAYTAEEDECRRHKNGNMSCNYNKLSIVTAKSNSQICILLKDAKNVTNGMLHITPEVQWKCTKENSFYTSPITIKTASIKRCPGMGSCKENRCLKTTWKSKIAELEEYYNYTGSTHCEESCSCITCGCLSCSAACMFYRIFAIPQDQDIEIFNCMWDLEVMLKTEVRRSLQDESRTYIVRPGETTKGNKITFGVQSTTTTKLDKTRINFIKEKKTAIISEQLLNMAKIYKCKKRGSECLLDRHKCLCRQADGEMSCDCNYNREEILRSIEEKVLPQSVNGIVIKEERDGTIKTNENSIITLTVALEGLTTATIVDNNRCEMKQVSVAGCFLCQEGAQVDYICTTDFGSQSTHVECDNFDFPIHCNKLPTRRRARIMSSKATINERCSIKCPSSETKFTIEGELYYIESEEDWKMADNKMVEQDWWSAAIESIKSIINKILLESIPITVITFVGIYLVFKLVKVLFKYAVL